MYLGKIASDRGMLVTTSVCNEDIDIGPMINAIWTMSDVGKRDNVSRLYKKEDKPTYYMVGHINKYAILPAISNDSILALSILSIQSLEEVSVYICDLLLFYREHGKKAYIHDIITTIYRNGFYSKDTVDKLTTLNSKIINSILEDGVVE